MPPADERARFDASDPLNRTWNWRILVQGAMCPRLIVIVGIRAKDAAQVRLAEHHEMVNALAADRANQPFGKTVLPRRTGRNRLVANTHRSQTTPDDGAIDPISITDQVAWCLVPGESLGDLPRDPFGRRMRRYVDPDKLAPSQSDNDQDIDQVERNGRHHKQVHGRNLRRMVAQEGSPARTGRVVIPLPCHILADGRRGDRKSELEQFTVSGAPHSGFSRLIRRISARSSAPIGGRPLGARDFQRQ
jgi:hypothetical protein